MILISALVDKAFYEVVQKHQTWIEETFVSENTEASLSAVVSAARNNNPDAFILLVVPSELEDFAKTLPSNDVCVYNADGDTRVIESSILYQGSPAVHRLVDSYKKQIDEASKSAGNAEELAWRVAEIENMQEKLTDSELEVAARDKRIHELEDERTRLVAEIENIQVTNAQANTELGAQRVQDEAKHRGEVEALNNRITELTEERAREISQMTEAVRTRDNTIEELNTALANANAQVEILRKGNEATSASPLQNDEARQQLQQQYLEAQREVISLRGQVDALNNELAGVNVTVEALTAKQSTARAEIEAANARAEASRKALEGVQRSIGDSSGEITRLRAENAQLHQELLAAGDSSNSYTSRELSLGLAKYTGKALIVGVCGYGSSYYVANAAASVANSLGMLTDVALIDLDPNYSSINGFYNISRFTAKNTASGKSAPYVSALNDGALFAAGLVKARQNKSGSVSFGGGCLGGLQKLNPDRFIEELNGLSATMSYIVLNLGCLSADLYPILAEISIAGKLVCVVDGAKMPVKFVSGQLGACQIPVQDASWILVSDTPVVDSGVDEVLAGANRVVVTEERANSRNVTLETGQFGRTFANFVATLSQ